MVVLRFKDRTPREYKVPFNVHIRGVEVPIGLSLIFLVLFTTAVLNFFTKEVATISGLLFTGLFLTIFLISEHYHEKRLKGARHEHLEQFNRQVAEAVTSQSLQLTKPMRKLVAIRSPHNLYMLEKALAETDPNTTDVIVMTAKIIPPGSESDAANLDLDSFDRQLMTAVVDRAEKAGKKVEPVIVSTNNPLHAVLKAAKELPVNEIMMGASNKYTADEQLEQIAFYWINLHEGQPAPLTVRIVSRDRDVHLDLAGGSRIPKISERQARSVAELRAAGEGVERVLLVHDGTPAACDLFRTVLTMLDPQVALALVPALAVGSKSNGEQDVIQQEQKRASRLGRELVVCAGDDVTGEGISRLAQDGQYDLIIVPVPPEPLPGQTSRLDARALYLLDRAHCRVFLAASPQIPQEVDR
jgi:hypothetical protein